MLVDKHPQYLLRLAQVYLDFYEKLGYAEASAWYERTLDDEHKQAVRPYILLEAQAREINME